MTHARTRTSSTRSTRPTRADLWQQQRTALEQALKSEFVYDCAYTPCDDELRSMLDELEQERCGCGAFFDEDTPHAPTCEWHLFEKVQTLERALDKFRA